MDLSEKIDVSIEHLKESEEQVFDFDKELELLLEVKKFVNEQLKVKNTAENYKTKNENLNKSLSDLRDEKTELQKKYNEVERELGRFCTFMQNEISAKMKLMEYSEGEIERVSSIKEFSELCSIRDKVFRKFEVKFRIQYMVKDTI